MEKKEWKTPELTVLVRSQPEETVLVACKTAAGLGPGLGFAFCSNVSGCVGVCSTIAAS